MEARAAEAQQDLELVTAVFQRLVGDLGLLCDRSFVVEEISAHQAQAKVAAAQTIHISFKLELCQGGRFLPGALIVPLAEAVSLACFLTMVPDETTRALRAQSTLDRSTKDALLEIGNLVAGAIDAVLRSFGGSQFSARSRGCQGIKPGQNPAFLHSPGEPLLIGRARVQLHDFPSFEMCLQLTPWAKLEAA